MYGDDELALRKLYEEFAAAARMIAIEEWIARGHPGVRLANIGPNALEQAAGWQGRRVAWDWYQLYAKWSRRPRHIGLAIWVDPRLCGLALGKVSDGRVHARLDRLERAPGATDDEIVRVAEIAIVYLEIFGRVANCREAVLWQPATALIPYYKAFGYETEIKKQSKIVGLKRALS